jgi:glycosyltransferase involved in cell wall biosynthesis
MKVALVHDYLNQAGGAERVLGVLHRMFPEAPIYTTILDRRALWAPLRDADIRTSWMQHLPGLRRHFKKYLPLYPRAIEQFDLRAFDLVISSSSAFAKGARVRAGAHHVCYCHTPMRFAWDFDRYIAREGFPPGTRLALLPIIRYLRRWDLTTKDRPHLYIANSSAVQQRIRTTYGRTSEIVFPPVDIARYAPSPVTADYYLVVARLNGYKRIDLAIEAFNALRSPLLVIGDGPQRPRLQRIAGPTVHFGGRLSDGEVAKHLAQCRGLVFPGEEDFGIAPIEAALSGRPVVAFKAGGALDTVQDGRTGVFFEEASPRALIDAVRRCEQIVWDRAMLRKHGEQFSEQVFRARIGALLHDIVTRGSVYSSAVR